MEYKGVVRDRKERLDEDDRIKEDIKGVMNESIHINMITINHLLILISILHISIQEGKHWQWRALDCITRNGTGPDHISKEPSECSLKLFESEYDENRRDVKVPICHDEVVNGVTRSYCNLLCPGADTVYLIKRKPQTHRSCFVFYTHELEKRGEDFYLWRINKCRHSQIEITVRCEFLKSREEFGTDAELFAKFRKRT